MGVDRICSRACLPSSVDRAWSSSGVTASRSTMSVRPAAATMSPYASVVTQKPSGTGKPPLISSPRLAALPPARERDPASRSRSRRTTDRPCVRLGLSGCAASMANSRRLRRQSGVGRYSGSGRDGDPGVHGSGNHGSGKEPGTEEPHTGRARCAEAAWSRRPSDRPQPGAVDDFGGHSAVPVAPTPLRTTRESSMLEFLTVVAVLVLLFFVFIVPAPWLILRRIRRSRLVATGAHLLAEGTLVLLALRPRPTPNRAAAPPGLRICGWHGVLCQRF